MDKPEPGAAVTTIVGSARLKIRLADPRQILVADADAVVLDHENDVSRLGASANRHFAAAVGEADRVRQKVEQNLMERPLIGDDFREFAARRTVSSQRPPRARATPKGRSKRQ